MFLDSRSDVSSPDSYSYSFEPHFKYGSSIGLGSTGGNPFYAVLGFRAWLPDGTGGKAHELAVSNDGRIFFRSGNSPTWEGWRTLLISNEQGFYGIGTTSPTEMLSVKGKIRAQEIKVEGGIWPDYVFKKDYPLMTLTQIDSFIKLNNHLPNMPAAKEVEKNGLDLGEMNRKLLQKIEELTLHLIEKDKQIQKLEKRMSKLETKPNSI
ncbi:hypothetical protein DBR43_14940 [Pedobacter sp. KBW06]|nr:hypothetical protein DBR43_14940 [Pedobacter sp. KBW06]